MAGRPRAFATVEDLQQGIDAYIAEETANEYPVTVSGLAYALGVDRATLFNYAQGEHEFFDTIKRAIAYIEADKAKKMLKGTYNTTAAIFDLKNNHGWKDQQHIKEESERTTKPDAVTVEQITSNVLKRLESARG